MNFRLILKTRVAVWPFSSATYWEDFFESCNVKHISIQTFISKNFSANFFLWLLFALFHRLPIRGILSDSNFFRRRNLSVVKIFSKLSNHTPYFSVLFLLIVGAFIIRIQTSQSVNFLLILKKKRGYQNSFLNAYQMSVFFECRFLWNWFFCVIRSTFMESCCGWLSFGPSRWLVYRSWFFGNPTSADFLYVLWQQNSPIVRYFTKGTSVTRSLVATKTGWLKCQWCGENPLPDDSPLPGSRGRVWETISY